MHTKFAFIHRNAQGYPQFKVFFRPIPEDLHTPCAKKKSPPPVRIWGAPRAPGQPRFRFFGLPQRPPDAGFRPADGNCCLPAGGDYSSYCTATFVGRPFVERPSAGRLSGPLAAAPPAADYSPQAGSPEHRLTVQAQVQVREELHAGLY